MATQLFFRSINDPVADTHRGTNTAKRDGTAVGWESLALATTRGAGVVSSTTFLSPTGPTNGIETQRSTNQVHEWLSPPVSADVTISGTITANIWASEQNMSMNAAVNVIIDILRATTSGADGSNTIQNIVQSTNASEVAVTTAGVNNFTSGMTSGAYTAQTLNRGDRLRIRIVADDAGTMASGFTMSARIGGTTAGVDGDSYVTFTEDFSFESAPAGSTLYLTDTASDVATASVDYEAWTSPGSGTTKILTSTPVAGWTAPIQMTDTFGGTVVDWFTKQLQAFTLEGMVVVNMWAQNNSAATNASARCEIARVNSDGTSATVWASWCIAPTGTDNGEVSTTNGVRTANVSGDALAFTNGQRIRIRFYIEDISSAAMTASGFSLSIRYAGTTPGASGDTYITLPQTVTEYTPPAAGGSAPRRRRPAHRYTTVR